MKKILFLIVILLSNLNLFAANLKPVRGRVVCDSGEAVGYATVVISRDNVQVEGGVTNEDGNFSFEVEAGEYELTISYVGYQTSTLKVESGKELGEVVLKRELTKIDNVVVTSNFIRREADRFVVDVANAPSSIGQDGEELLKSSPGVWIMDDKISINGNSNPKVYVNDRELKLSSEQLMIYLRNLKSEDVRRVEVIPQSGAELDATASSGVIMIYLKRQVKSGMIGSVTFHSGLNGDMQNYSPSANINYQTEKLSLNTSAWYSGNKSNSSTSVNTKYTNLATTLSDLSESETNSSSLGGRIEAIYNFNNRHSIGAELNYMESDDNSLSKAKSAMVASGVESLSSSLYDAKGESNNLSATFNYIYKLDTLGSTLKLLADYNNNRSDNFSDNIVNKSNDIDSLHRSSSASDFTVATVSLAAEKIFTPKLTLKSGAKYTYNDMDSRSNYSYFGGDVWQDLVDYNKSELYTEEIAAAYLIGSSRLGRWSAVVGLRAEYTQTKGRDNILNKNYLSWFPNANVSYLFDAAGSNSLTAQYSRSITRPSFWSLNPARNQSSEYVYSIGNPSLLPEYKNSLSLTYVYKYKYSLTASLQVAENSIVQIMMQDSDNPNVTYISSENIDNQSSYFLSANLPFQFTKWWSLNANITYGYRGEKINNSSATQYQHMLFTNAQSSFTLPLEFYLTLGYYKMSDVYSGNIKVKGSNYTSVSLSKKFLDKRLNASISASNIFSSDHRLSNKIDGVEQTMVMSNGWMLPRVGFSISYNFKAGKEYRERSGVESASAEDRARIAK